MINFNGSLENDSIKLFNANNRAFKYGDALFETIKVENLKIIFLEDHYFRLMASMRMLRMEIPMNFTLEFLQDEILKTVLVNTKNNSRVRLCITRKDGGFYTPTTNEIDYLIESREITFTTKDNYKVDLYINSYKDLIVNTRIDSVVTNVQIDSFYNLYNRCEV